MLIKLLLMVLVILGQSFYGFAAIKSSENLDTNIAASASFNRLNSDFEVIMADFFDDCLEKYNNQYKNFNSVEQPSFEIVVLKKDAALYKSLFGDAQIKENLIAGVGSCFNNNQLINFLKNCLPDTVNDEFIVQLPNWYEFSGLKNRNKMHNIPYLNVFKAFPNAVTVGFNDQNKSFFQHYAMAYAGVLYAAKILKKTRVILTPFLNIHPCRIFSVLRHTHFITALQKTKCKVLFVCDSEEYLNKTNYIDYSSGKRDINAPDFWNGLDPIFIDCQNLADDNAVKSRLLEIKAMQ